MAAFDLSRIKIIIFDLDGTLVDAYKPVESSFNFTMRKIGLPKQSALTIRKAVGWGDENLLAPFVPRVKLSQALTLYRRHHRKELKIKSRLFPQVRQLLLKLSSCYKLAVASNRPTQFSLILLKALKIKKYFDFILCADKLKTGKPHPDILKRIIRHFRLKPCEALYVGDMVIDAQTAQRARIKSIIVTTGSSSLGEIRKERPFKVIAGIKELEKILNI